MPIIDQLNQDLKTALKAGEETRKAVLRQVLAGTKEAMLNKRTASAAATRKKQNAELTEAQYAELENISLDDNETLGVIQKEAKSRRESIADAQKANRADLVADNEAELKIIEGYLPQALTREEITALARAAIAEAGATDPKQMGLVMKLLTPRTAGRAEGKLVSEVVRELLSH